MSVWLGVDGGGTKTALALIDENGRVLGTATGPTLYYFSVGLDVARDVLIGVTREACAAAGLKPDDVSFAFLGLPGYGEVRADTQALDALPRAALGHDRYRCGNDTICGWAGSLAGQDGVNVVAGTGSITYGERDGRGVRVGGWGEIFGDEGSAYWIGVAALRTVSRMSDGRAPDGALRPALLDHLGLTEDIDLLDVLFTQWKGDRGRIASLAVVVSRCAAAGDPDSVRILEAAADELALLVGTTARRLGYGQSEEVPVSWSGGVFASPPLMAAFRDRLSTGGRYRPVEPRFSPVLGAALYAARLAGSPLSDTALERLPAS